MTPSRTFRHWLVAGMLFASLADIGHTKALPDDAVIFGTVEAVNWSALEIMVFGQHYQLSGSTLVQWQNGMRTDLQALQPGLQVQILIEPPRNSAELPRVRSLILQAD